MTRLAIFASGRGSNALTIIKYFQNNPEIKVNLIVSNKATALVLNLGKQFDIPTMVIDRKNFYQSSSILKALDNHQTDLIILAGFLWLIPGYLVNAYNNKILNIHPALLPKYGGKGMYGMNVHKAVHAAKEKEAGITIHYVNERYDEGNIIFQAKTEIVAEDSPEMIAKKVLALEHKYFPIIIEKVIQNNKPVML